MTLAKLLKHPIHQLALVAFLAGIAAIMFTKGLTEILFEGRSPFLLLGVSLLIIVAITIVTFKFPDPKAMSVMAIGLIFIGYAIMFD